MPKKQTTALPAKYPVVHSVNSDDSSERHTFKLTRNRIQEIPHWDDAYVYAIKRSTVKNAFKQLDAGATAVCDLSFSRSTGGDYENVTHTADTLNRGRVQIGCQVFSARAVKAIRTWAGV